MKDELNTIIIETHRDVRWICRTLEEMKETDADVECRLPHGSRMRGTLPEKRRASRLPR